MPSVFTLPVMDMSSFTVNCAEPVAIVFTGGTSCAPPSLALTSAAEAHIVADAVNATTMASADLLKVDFMLSPVRRNAIEDTGSGARRRSVERAQGAEGNSTPVGYPPFQRAPIRGYESVG